MRKLTETRAEVRTTLVTPSATEYNSKYTVSVILFTPGIDENAEALEFGDLDIMAHNIRDGSLVFSLEFCSLSCCAIPRLESTMRQVIHRTPFEAGAFIQCKNPRKH